MGESSVRPEGEAGAPSTAAGEADDREHSIGDLRELLVRPEREHLAAIQARLDDPEVRRRELGEVLPEALLQHALDPALAHALAPSMERAITESVRQNPAPLADALFPIMGPAIRRAVASALSGMVDSLNRTLEHSLSWRSINWRYEGYKSGKPFAEIILLHTLLYRVEQVFLIDRSSGLLLHHVHAGSSDVKDVDMVSGMLTAIRDFVQDSFRVSAGDSLEALKVGELSVWIEQGPRAVVAAVLRGAAPRTYRATLQQAIETFHLEFGDVLERFSGDTAVFDPSRPILETCLQTEYRPDEAKPRTRRLLWFAAAAAVLLAIWSGLAVRDQLRWGRYLDSLNAEPGIIVVSSGRRGGHFAVTGLRDPLSRDPAAMLAQTSIPAEDVDAHWESYHASTPALAVVRARQVLQPPEGVTLDLRDGVLAASGAAPVSWVSEASRLAPLIAGVTRLDASASVDASVKSVIARLEALTPLFSKGQVQLAAGQEEILRQLVSAMQDLHAIATAARRHYRIELVGHTDADGVPDANVPLSRSRADFIRAGLSSVPTDGLDIVSRGVGSDDPAGTSTNEADKQRNRRVTVHVTAIGG